MSDDDHKLSGKPSLGSLALTLEMGHTLTIGDGFIEIDYVENAGQYGVRLYVRAPSWLTVHRDDATHKERQKPLKSRR